MARSRKKIPVWKDGCPSYVRWAKRQSSKSVRKNWRIDNGGMYKKVYCSYNIHDSWSKSFTKQDIDYLKELYLEYQIWMK